MGYTKIRHLTQTQVSAIIWTILLTWLRTKNGGCVSHGVKKIYKIQNNKKINENVRMLLFLFEIKSMESIKRGFMFNFLVIAQKYIFCTAQDQWKMENLVSLVLNCSYNPVKIDRIIEILLIFLLRDENITYVRGRYTFASFQDITNCRHTSCW